MTDDKLVNSFDARHWVDAWMRTIAEHPEIATDRETMTTWFAHAIMAGYDQALRNAAMIQKAVE